MNASEPLGTKPIFLATLCSTNPKKDIPSELSIAHRKFIWLEDSNVVSILMYCENGYYFECVVLPVEEARTYWHELRSKGWICRIKKTEQLRGFHVRTRAAEIQKESEDG